MAGRRLPRLDGDGRPARRNQQFGTGPIESLRRGDRRHGAFQPGQRSHPCACHGVVCARDFTHDPAGGFDAHAFADWLRGRVLADPPERRVKYVISNGRIFSGVGQKHPAGKWRPYSGANRHEKHVHVSICHGEEAFDDCTPWGWAAAACAPAATLAEPAWPIPQSFPSGPPMFPLPAGHWFGRRSPDPRNHSGYDAADRPAIRAIALTLKARLAERRRPRRLRRVVARAGDVVPGTEGAGGGRPGRAVDVRRALRDALLVVKI